MHPGMLPLLFPNMHLRILWDAVLLGITSVLVHLMPLQIYTQFPAATLLGKTEAVSNRLLSSEKRLEIFPG